MTDTSATKPTKKLSLKENYALLTRGLDWETTYQPMDEVYRYLKFEGIKIHDWDKWEDPFRMTMDAYWKYQGEKERKLYAIIDAFQQNSGQFNVTDVRYIQALKIFLRRDIGGHGNGGAGMGGIDFSGYLFARTSLTRRNHHLGPMVGHTFRHSPANAARRASDDGDLTGQIEQVHGLFPNEFFCFKQMLGPAWRQAGGRSSLSG